MIIIIQILPFLNRYRRVRPPQLEEEVDRLANILEDIRLFVENC
jgi:hypothetical protein